MIKQHDRNQLRVERVSFTFLQQSTAAKVRARTQTRSVAFAENGAGSSFLGGKDSPAMESYCVIANLPVVVDNRSGVIKAGSAGDQTPKYFFPNYVGRPRHVRVMAGALDGDIVTGPRAEERWRLLSVCCPVEHGVVKDWNDMERIWRYVCSKDQMQTFSEEHPALLTEAPLNPRRNRERAAEVFFTTFSVPTLFISVQAVLSLYATGRTTGVVLDSGDGVTHAVLIYEGITMPHSVMCIDIAGRDVSHFLCLCLRKEGYDFHSSSEFDIVKSMQERACRLSITPGRMRHWRRRRLSATCPMAAPLRSALPGSRPLSCCSGQT